MSREDDPLRDRPSPFDAAVRTGEPGDGGADVGEVGGPVGGAGGGVVGGGWWVGGVWGEAVV